jgi:hypothetical protein
MRFTGMIAGRNVGCTLRADTADTAVSPHQTTGTALEAFHV